MTGVIHCDQYTDEKKIRSKPQYFEQVPLLPGIDGDAVIDVGGLDVLAPWKDEGRVRTALLAKLLLLASAQSVSVELHALYDHHCLTRNGRHIHPTVRKGNSYEKRMSCHGCNERASHAQDGERTHLPSRLWIYGRGNGRFRHSARRAQPCRQHHTTGSLYHFAPSWSTMAPTWHPGVPDDEKRVGQSDKRDPVSRRTSQTPWMPFLTSWRFRGCMRSAQDRWRILSGPKH